MYGYKIAPIYREYEGEYWYYKKSEVKTISILEIDDSKFSEMMPALYVNKGDELVVVSSPYEGPMPIKPVPIIESRQGRQYAIVGTTKHARAPKW